MKRLFLTLLCLLALCNIADARTSQGIAGAVTASSGTTYVFPQNVTSDSDFDTATTDIANTVAIGDTIALPSQTINKLYFHLSDKQTATECSVALYNNDANPLKLVGCHFTPANGWNSCDVSYSATAGTFTIWGQCNQAYKATSAGVDATPDCNNYYKTTTAYTQDMPSNLGSRTADVGCTGQKVSY